MSKPADCPCPKCQTTSHRRSRWRSREEKHEHPGMEPVRCVGCGHRFLVPAKPELVTQVGPVVRVGAVGIGAVMLALAAFLMVSGSDEPPEEVSAALTHARSSPVAPAILEAAEAGDPEAQFRVGRSLMHDGIVDDEDAPEALDWLQKAAHSGNTGAMVHLGRMYLSGIGALQNFDLAADWIGRAAASNDPEGMLELGRLYRDGIGMEQDLVLAYVWLNRSAAKRNRNAALERDRVMQRLNQEELKDAQRLSLELEAGEGDGGLP